MNVSIVYVFDENDSGYNQKAKKVAIISYKTYVPHYNLID